MIERYTLSNGVQVVAEQLPGVRSVSVGLWVHAGSMMEQPAENGISHFLEHMAFKGTGRRSNRELAREMDAHGGHFNAFTSRDCTCFYAQVIDEDLAFAVDMLSDIGLHASMEPAELEKERGVVLEEIAMDEDDPEALASDLLQQAQYGEQAIGQSILGTAERVSAYTREDLLRYRDSHYTPERCVLAVCGSYDPAQLRALAERCLGEWRGQEASPLPAPPELRLGVRTAKVKDVEQLQLALGYPGLPYGDPDHVPLSLMSTVLGGAMSSRLFQRVREELGMAYSIYASAMACEGSGTLVIGAGVAPENGRQVLEETLRVIAELRDKGVTGQEFTEVKRQLRTSYLLGLESSSGRMQGMGRRLLLTGRVRETEETLARLEAVTIDQVQEVSCRLLSAEPCLAAVGRNAEEFAQ